MKTKAWHDARRKGIGGSDAPIIILGNDHPFTTPYELWQDKMGRLPPAKETAPMRRGTMMEPIIADIYESQTGRKITMEKNPLIHPAHKFMRTNLDGWIDCPERGRGVYEAKCPNMANFQKCKRYGPLDYYIIQLQHNMEVAGVEWGSFGIFNAELWKLLVFDLDKDKSFVPTMIEMETGFWDCVVNKTPPQEGERDLLIKMPEVEFNSKVIKMDFDEWEEVVNTLRTAQELRKEAEEIEANAKQTMIQLMEKNGAEVAEGAGLRAYYRPQKGRRTFNHTAFAIANPTLDLEPWYKTGRDTNVLRTYFFKEEMTNE